MEPISQQRLMALEPIDLPPWCIDKLPKPLRSAIDRWNAAVPEVDRSSRTAVLRARVELQSILGELVALAKQWSEEALGVSMARSAEVREYLLPPGSITNGRVREYTVATEQRVRADPVVRQSREAFEDARRLHSDLSGLSALNSACVRQLEGSAVDRQPSGASSTPLFSDRRQPAVLKGGV